jgi:aryl-alcohol dehydrogenase-like predicted oxidoreductase
LLVEALKKLPNTKVKSLKFICKLANPHFGDNAFDAVRLKQSVERHLQELNTDRIDVLQWMWRIKPFNDDLRCDLFEDSVENLIESFESLVNEGKIGTVSCFPYSKDFMVRVRKHDVAQGQVNYLNLSQLDALEYGLGPYTIALRGACVGDLGSVKNCNGLSLSGFNDPYRMIYRFPLLSPKVVTSVISLNSKSHMELASSVLDTAPNEKEFQRYALSRWNEFDMK